MTRYLLVAEGNPVDVQRFVETLVMRAKLFESCGVSAVVFKIESNDGKEDSRTQVYPQEAAKES